MKNSENVRIVRKGEENRGALLKNSLEEDRRMRARRKFPVLLALILVFAFLVPAYASAGTAKKIIIGYDAYSDTVNFSKKISDNLKANMDKAGYTLIRADSKGDPATAMKNVDAFLAQGANYIIECSWVVAAVEAVAKKSKDAGVPCISIDISVPDAYFFGVNNFEAGKTTGGAAVQYIKKNWANKVDFVVLAHSENFGAEVKKRTLGIANAIREAGIPLAENQIVWMDPKQSDGTMAMKQMGTDFLTAHPNAKKIVFGCVNDQAGLGFFSAVETSGRANDAIIVSQGCDEPAIANLRKPANFWLGSTGYMPEQYGDYLIKLINDLIAGKKLQHDNYIKTIFIDKSNIEKYYPGN